MMNLSEGRAVIKAAVEAVLDDMRNTNVRPISKASLTEMVMDQWVDGVEGEAADVALVALHDSVWNTVSSRMNSDKKQESKDADPQMVMEGFARLQKAYVCTVENEQVYVLTEEMTDEQLQEKAEEHRRFGRGNYQHAEEIERYIEERHDAQTGQAKLI